MLRFTQTFTRAGLPLFSVECWNCGEWFTQTPGITKCPNCRAVVIDLFRFRINRQDRLAWHMLEKDLFIGVEDE